MARRDLSHGHFSEDNQKRLVGSSWEIPIFEAKMTGDTRLVVGSTLVFKARQLTLQQYMVDCIQDFETEVSGQVTAEATVELTRPRISLRSKVRAQ